MHFSTRLSVPLLRHRCFPMCLSALLLFGACGDDDGGGNNNNPPDFPMGTVVGWVDNGLLAEVEASFGTLQVIRVQGSYYDMGYQYGYLLGQQVTRMWEDVMMPYIGEEIGLDPELATDIFTGYLDLGWNHMEPNVPQRFLDEMNGIYDGATAANHPDPLQVYNVVRWILELGEVAGAIDDDLGAMNDFFSEGYTEELLLYYGEADAQDALERERRDAMDGRFMPSIFLDEFARALPPFACAFFAAWGDRTDGGMIATRTMDWSADIGLSSANLVTIFVPDDGAAYMTVGYVGFLGALAGMSETGLSVSSVEASSSMMRIHASPGLLRLREIMAYSDGLDDAEPYFADGIDDGMKRPATIGANLLLAYGDPAGGGAGAEAVALESSGVYAGMFRNGPAPSCEPIARLYEFAFDGSVANVWNSVDDPDMANPEGAAYEVDASGIVRTFEVDGSGDFVYDATGLLIPDPAGEPFPNGLPLSCAVYRADTAMAKHVRRWQFASNGPQRDSNNHYAHLSGAYRNRYRPHHDMLRAYYEGTAFEWQSETVIPDNGGAKTLIGVEQAMTINSVVGDDDSCIFAVVYDLTNLVMYATFESGTGDTWVNAAENEYLEFRFADLIPAR
ncbi:MAG: hypothetical protein ABI333_08960 [bacterium]